MQMDRELCKGTYSRVFAVHNQQGKFAMKVVDGSLAAKDLHEKFLTREVWLWPTLQHQNIVRMYHLYTHPLVHILQLELVEGTDLHEFVKDTNGGRGLSDRTAQLYFRQIGCALQYIHSLGVAHRDLKMENILLNANSSVVKICDFGFCRAASRSGDLSQTFCGSVAYARNRRSCSESRTPSFPPTSGHSGYRFLCLRFLNWNFSLFNSCS